MKIDAHVLGEEASRRGASTSLRLAHGFHKSEDSTRYTICGSIRECRSYGFGTDTYLSWRRNLETRKETRENAWQIDGWAETVDKVRFDRFELL